MDSAWLMAVAVGVCNSGAALAGKGAERHRCRAASYGLVGFGVGAVTAFLASLGRGGVWADAGLWAFGAAMGGLSLAATVAMLRANRCWPPSLVWAAANMAFVLPILLSALFLGEPLRRLDAAILAGVAVMLAGLVDWQAAGGGGEARPAARWFWLGLVFLISGALMMAFKLFGVLLPGRSPACLVAISYGSGCALALAIQAGRGEIAPRRMELGWGLAAGLTGGLSYLAMLAAMRLPAAAAFPVIQGTSLSGGMLACALVFGERLTGRKLAALAVGLAAMTLTVWR
jgi:hypothetical protein